MWKGKSLFFNGGSTMLSAVIPILPTNYMSIFIIHKWVLRTLKACIEVSPRRGLNISKVYYDQVPKKIVCKGKKEGLVTT